MADDEEPILALLSETFERLGYGFELLLARDGEEALAIARREKPDVLILDVSMPKQNGYEVCAAVKNDPATAHAKVAMLTGLDYDVARRQAFRDLGADWYFFKPLSPLALAEKVKEFLDAK